ncbi:MAG: ribosomal-protein-alanine N-acetyltransferase [Ruminococcaceae bacterium]|nr:ribosomal-protein-alanine N-acetyltransferase [Oscillospiraceae bacterium]
MTDTILRLCTEADLDAVYAIEQRSFSTPWSRESFASALHAVGTEIWLLTDEQGTILGFGCLMTIAGEGEVLNIAVDPAYRRKGYGEILLSAMLTSAVNRGAEEIFLEVRASNTPARTLYEKYGFAPIGIRKKYYTNPTEDAVCMRCEPRNTGIIRSTSC